MAGVDKITSKPIDDLSGLAKAGKKDSSLKLWIHADIAKLVNHPSVPLMAYQFCAAFEFLCVGGKNPNAKFSKDMRAIAWTQLDNNGNGHVSLAETGKWVQDHLIGCFKDKDLGMKIYKYFYPCFIRAFLDAADYGERKKVGQKGKKQAYFGTATTDDWVQFAEFRLLCSYLVIYAVIWEAFACVDGGGAGVTKDDDRRISLDEWSKCVSSGKLGQHPLLSLAISAKDDPAVIFKQMDGDGKGKVLLAEFCTFIEDYEFGLETMWGKLLNAGEAVPSAGAKK